MSLIRFPDPLRLPLPSFQSLFTALKASFSLLSCTWQVIQLLHLLCNGWLFLRAAKCFQLEEYKRITDELRCIRSLPMEDVDDESVTRLLWQMDTLDAMSTRQLEAERDQAILFARLWEIFTPHVF